MPYLLSVSATPKTFFAYWWGFIMAKKMSQYFLVFLLSSSMVGAPLVLKAQDTTKVEDNIEKPTQLPLDNVQEILHRYEEAEAFYHKGKIDSIPRILGVYLKNKSLLRRIEKGAISDIYRLSALSYILMDSLEQAEQQIKNLLSNQHNYQIRQGDLLSFKASLDTLYISPRLTLGMRVGWLSTFVQKNGSVSVIQVINDDNTEQQAIAQDEAYSIDYFGVRAGIALGFYFNRHFSLHTELSSTNIGFKYQRLLSTDVGNNIDYQYAQSLNYIEVPAYLQYNFFKKPKFTPYVLLGVSYRYLVSSLKTISTTSVNVTPMMQAHNIGALAGVGISKSLGTRWAVQLDAKYRYNVGNINRANKRFMNNGEGNIDVFLYNAYDAIDDITIQNISVNIGVTYYLRYKVF